MKSKDCEDLGIFLLVVAQHITGTLFVEGNKIRQ